MKTTRTLGLFIAVCLTVAAFADQPAVRVVASTDLRLVIVDPVRATPERVALHQAFAASLGRAMAAVVGGPVAVQLKTLNADSAAFGLTNGGCHCVLAIGKTLPRQLALSDTTRLKATLGAGASEREAFLISSNDDLGLQQLLTKAFASAITDGKFLDALDGGGEGVPERAGKGTLAAAGP